MTRKAFRSVPSSMVRRRSVGRTTERGLVNGSSSRLGAGGLVNGSGLVNGGVLTATAGKVNGRGLINGVGYTNGHTNLSLRRNRFGIIFQRDFKVGLSLVVLFLLLTPAATILLETKEYVAPIRIDSEFGDWADITKLTDDKVVGNDNVNIQEYSTIYDRGHIYFYLEVAARIFDDHDGLDGFYIFIDEDRNPSSGYQVRDMGADFMIEVFGGEGEVRGSRFSAFRGSERNWSAWSSVGNPVVGLKDSRMEVSIFSTEIDDGFDALVYSTDFEGNECFTSLKFSPRLASLVIAQSGVSELLGVGSESFLKIDFTAGKDDVIVQELNLSWTGNISIEPINFLPLSLEDGRTYTEFIRVDTTPATVQDFTELGVESATARDALGGGIPVTIRGQSARAYIGEKPDGKKIDGLFDDWTERSFDGIDDNLTNRNVDILEYSADKDETLAYFYMRTDGIMLGGSAVPRIRAKSEAQGPPTNGMVHIPREVTGEDITRIYVDSNSSDWYGLYLGGMRYDYMIEIRGIYGKVLPHRSLLFRWDGAGFSEWATVKVKKNAHKMECSTILTSLGSLHESSILFVTTDWSGGGDTIGEPTDWSTRGGTRTIYVVEDTSPASSDTAYSNQRKLFYDGSYYWSFYYNGTQGNISYEYSSDGTTWDSIPGYFPVAGAGNASLWFNSSNSMVYVVADNGTASKNVTVVSGSIFGATIVWDSPAIVEVSGLDEDYKVAYVAVNSSGHIWVASTTRNRTNAYNINVTYTTNPEDLSSWSNPELMRSPDVSNEYVYPVILPLTATDTYVLWYADGYLEGRNCSSGIWSTVDDIEVMASGASNKGPSAVADSSGYIHMIYVNSSGYVNYSKYTGTWSETNLNSTITGRSPTITLEMGSSYLYVLWIDSTNQIVGNYSTDGGNSWNQITSITSNSEVKGNLTSIYSCNLNNVAWEFDSSTKINFERIPEFTDIILPVVSITVLVLIRRRKNATETQEEA